MISPDNKKTIEEVAAEAEKQLARHYTLGFGIFPSPDPKDNYYNQVWARDFAHAAGVYYASVNSEIVLHSFETILKYQRPDGMLPYRVEREYEMIKFVPGFRHLAKPLFDFFEGTLRGRHERPVYENEGFGGGEDTIPAVLVAMGAFFEHGAHGKQFVKDHFHKLEKAVAFFSRKTDPSDGLAITNNKNPDWADTIKRHGKLGTINVWWVKGLESMAQVAAHLDKKEEAERYQAMFKKVRDGIFRELYNHEYHYFKAESHEERIDTVASVFGSLYLLDAAEAVKVEETLHARLKHPSGLKNFHPRYPREQTFWIHRILGQDQYHNDFVWPWVNAQNILVKIKIAKEHEDSKVREEYKAQTLNDLLHIAEIFRKSGGAHEVLDPDEARPPMTKFYKTPPNFMGSLAAFAGAYIRVKALHWI